MLLNEPTPHHQMRPAAAGAAASTRRLPPVEVDGAPAQPPRARGGDGDSDLERTAETRSTANDPTVGIELVDGTDAVKTVALDVEAVKRAVAEGISLPDATATVSLNVEAVRKAMAESAGGASGSAVGDEDSGAPAAERDGEDEAEVEASSLESSSAAAADSAGELETDAAPEGDADAERDYDAAPDADAAAERDSDAAAGSASGSAAASDSGLGTASGSDAIPGSAAAGGSDAEPDFDAEPGSDAPRDSDSDSGSDADADSGSGSGSDPELAAASDSAAARDLDAASDFDTEPTSSESTAAPDTVEAPVEAPEAATSADLVPATGDAVDRADLPTATYLVSTDLSTPTSTLVAVPETADDVIATIHAAATAVAAADRRARQAAVVKEDPWTGLDLHRPAVPAPVDNVLDLLSPVLERPLLVVEQPGLPAAADVVALHRSELEVDFVEPPVVAAGAEPPIPPRYGPGLSVLPHIEFPV
ncbi:hypothetical protein ABIA31_002771 [Catenulispora sp. MAP5-51]|uniref:hypothetical protein n=1 Tax=Catenulispora sp. MAP5-51 TaxID=3156298 RepID=UPI00351573C5